MIGADDKKPKKPLSLEQDYSEQPKSGQTVVDASNPYTVYVPGPTAVPNQGQNQQGWYSSPRPTSLVYENKDAAKNAGYGNLDDIYGDGAMQWVDRVAKAIDYRSTGPGLYQMALDAISDENRRGPRLTPLQWIEQYARERGVSLSGGDDPSGGPGSRGPSGGGSGSGGPSARVDYDNAPAFDVRSIADAVSMEMLGRGVEQDEMERILKRVRKYENRNPSVTTGQSAGGTSVSRSSGGATNAGRQEVIERMLAKNPEFGDYQAATTVMGWFDNWLEQRGQAVG